MIRKIGILVVTIIFSVTTYAKNDAKKSDDGYQFTPVIELQATPVKDQHRSGTCWAYSALSFLESELIRMGKPEMDLSEMYVVWNCYTEKAEKYVRMHGKTNFGPGGAFHDVTWVIDNYGMVPQSAYDGLAIGEDKPIHGEMHNALDAYVKSIVENKNKKLSPVWQDGLKALLDVYLGELPVKFDYDGAEYTPLGFASEYMQINPDDYVEIGSFTHHPFYEPFIIEIPDNWLWDEIYNVPIDELMDIIDNAIESGYTIAWGADVSDKGFATKKKGVAVVPDVDYTEMTDSEISKWEDMEESEKKKELYKLVKPGKEKEITQVMRQIDFNNYTSTDDHGMHIIGTAKDQNGTIYYKVKNSWGEYNRYDGYFYASKPYIALRTIDIMVHKDAIPKYIRKKLNL